MVKTKDLPLLNQPFEGKSFAGAPICRGSRDSGTCPCFIRDISHKLQEKNKPFLRKNETATVVLSGVPKGWCK